MGEVLLPRLAGMWYPDDPDELRTKVRGYIKDAHVDVAPPKAIIAPHAGYEYSGPIAGSAYAAVQPLRNRVRRVILAGPAHRVPVDGLAAPSFSSVSTPLGEIPVDREALAAIRDLRQVRVMDTPFALGENSLELHYPFLRVVFDDFKLLPLAVGQASPEDVSEVFDRLWGGPETLIVVSSDLSHYHDYRTAKRMDKATSAAIEELNPKAISYDQACGRIPIAGLLLAAKKHGLHAKTIDLRSSGDTAGPRDEVVGYGAYVFE